ALIRSPSRGAMPSHSRRGTPWQGFADDVASPGETPDRAVRPRRDSLPIEGEAPMHDELTLEMVDRDGAIAEAAEAVSGHSRADFLKTAGLAAGGALLG